MTRQADRRVWREEKRTREESREEQTVIKAPATTLPRHCVPHSTPLYDTASRRRSAKIQGKMRQGRLNAGTVSIPFDPIRPSHLLPTYRRPHVPDERKHPLSSFLLLSSPFVPSFHSFVSRDETIHSDPPLFPSPLTSNPSPPTHARSIPSISSHPSHPIHPVPSISSPRTLRSHSSNYTIDTEQNRTEKGRDPARQAR